jgi:hypothetical protein
VRRILENPVYIGKTRHKGNLYDGLHQAIVTEDIWQKVQSILKKNSDKNKIRIPISRVSSPPLLRGMINCGICGSKMMPIYTSKGSKKYRYYICYSKAIGNNEACAVGRVPANEIESIVISRVLLVLKKPEFLVHAISQSTGTISESVVINSFKEIEKIWDELFPLEQARIVNLLIKNVIVTHKGLNIKIFKTGLHSLSHELFN